MIATQSKIPSPPSGRHWPASGAGRFLAFSGICYLLLCFLSAPARAQAPALKTVHGTVLNKSEDPLPEAVVFLKKLQSGTIRTYIADAQGEYHFTGLDPNADYEIHAEYKGDSSPTRRLSSLDGRKDIHLNLVVTPKK